MGEADEIRKELDEVRKLKDELRREIEEMRRVKRELRLERPEYRFVPPKHLHPPHMPGVDLRELTDSLEEMMEGLGEQIRESLKVVECKAPFLGPALHMHDHRRRMFERHLENITPERIAQIISPLGSEERLKILDFLKSGGKSFNELETYIKKTGSSLTHHLMPLLDAGYVIKGEARGTYYVTVEGRLAYRLAQWLTSRVEKQRSRTGSEPRAVKIEPEGDEQANKEGEL